MAGLETEDGDYEIDPLGPFVPATRRLWTSMCVSERNRRENARTIPFAITNRIRSICYNRMRKPQWVPSHLSALQRTTSSNGRPRNTTASRLDRKSTRLNSSHL